MSTAVTADPLRNLALQGPLTICNAAETLPRLQAALEGARELHIDLSEVDDIDCAGLQLLIATARQASRQHVELHFEGGNPALDELLRLSGLIDLQCLHDKARESGK